MMRKAIASDLSPIADIYDEVIDFQSLNGGYMSWIKGVYPTKKTAEDALSLDRLYVFIKDCRIVGSVILDCEQPTEYSRINWATKNDSRRALVIHTLCVAPEYMGIGIATEMLTFAKELAASLNCASLRLATNSKNNGAIHLYEKNGFSVVGYDKVLLDGKIECPRQCFMEFII